MRGNYKFPFQLFCQGENLLENFIPGVNSNEVYSNTYRLVSDYKNLFPNGCEVINRVYDELILSEQIFDVKTSKARKIIFDFMNNLTVTNYRVLFNFLYFIQGRGADAMESFDSNDDLLTTQYEILSGFSVLHVINLLLCLSGGILYKDFILKDGTLMNLGYELNKVVQRDTVRTSKLFNYNEDSLKLLTLVYYGIEGVNNTLERIRKLNIESTLDKFYKTSKNVMFAFCYYYQRLLTFTNACEIEDVKRCFMNYSDRVVHFDLMDLFNGSGFEDMIYACMFNSNLEDLYTRKYLVPNSGIRIESEVPLELGGVKLSPEYRNTDCVVCEGYDELIGYYIFNLSRCPADVFCNYINLTGKFNNIFKFDSCNIQMFNFYGVEARNEIDPGKFIVCNIFNGISGVDQDGNLLNVSVKFNNYVSFDYPYEVTLPSYWKYKDTIKSSSSFSKNKEDSGVYVDKNIKINPFKRRLGAGQHRSPEADALAKKLCIKLKEDETIVDEFERTQKVKFIK